MMKKRFFGFAALCGFALAAGPFTWASDVSVSTHLEVTESLTGDLVAGLVTVEVMNMSGADITNVNLRPTFGGELALSAEVLQFGPIADGAVGVAQHAFHAPEALIDAATPVQWRLDYDDGIGGHVQTVVASEQRP